MKVRSGLPYWRAIELRPPEIATEIATEGDASCEVVVIGGGVTGALVAFLLVRAGVQVILVDRGQPAAASTAASTGLLQYEVDTHLVELARRVGQDAAVHTYRRGLTAIDELEQRTEEIGDACGFSRRKTLYFCSRPRDLAALQKEFEARLASGFDVEWLSREALRERTSIDSHGAILSVGDAQIDPYRFTRLLLARSKGLKVYCSASIAAIEETDRNVIVRSDKGRIVAGQVVYAVGYASGQFLEQPVGQLHSTYALASEPISSFGGWPDGCLIWETARPYCYARQTDDGRAIIGGADTPYADDHQRDLLVERQCSLLLERFSNLFPAIRLEPAYEWAGTFGETRDGLAYIGQEPSRPRAYFALGYGGNGITFGAIAARLICDLYLRRPNADAAVFGFARRWLA